MDLWGKWTGYAWYQAFQNSFFLRQALLGTDDVANCFLQISNKFGEKWTCDGN